MNDFRNDASVIICLVGGIYALRLLVDCYRQLRRGESRDKPAGRAGVSTRIDWLCQLFFAATFLIVAGVVLIAAARQSLPAMASLRVSVINTEPMRSVQIPGVQPLPPRRLQYDCDRPGRPLVGADLADLPITDADLRALARHAPQLEWLILAETEITDEGLASVANLRSLEVLNLTDTRITDSGLAHLAELKNLEILMLAETRITNDSVKHLGRISSLQGLSLSRTAVTEDAIESLKQLPRLKFLYFH